MIEKPEKKKRQKSSPIDAPTAPFSSMADQLRKMEARLLCLKALGVDVELDLARIVGTRRTLGIAEE